MTAPEDTGPSPSPERPSGQSVAGRAPAELDRHDDRRANRRWSWVVGALVLAGIGVLLGPALIGRGVLLDVDNLMRTLPWATSLTSGSHGIGCRGDTIDYFMPGIANIKEAFLHGHFPTWAPDEVGGTPLASLPNHASLSPLSIPYWVLPLWLAPAWVKLAEFVAVLIGMVGFLRQWKVRTSAALLAAFVFFTCGFMVEWTNWPQTRVAAFIPWIFWGIERCIRHHRGRDVVILGFGVASMLLGGFPSVTLFTLTAGAVYALARLIHLGVRRHRPLGTTAVATLSAGGGIVLGAALSAVQLLPFAKDIDSFNLAGRNVSSEGKFREFFTTVAPTIHGTCKNGIYPPGQIPIETVGYVGAGTLLLVLIALLVRRRPGQAPTPLLLIVLMAVAVELIWAGGRPLALLQKLPGYDSNPITRGVSVFGFLAAAVAAFGFDRLIARTQAVDSSPLSATASPTDPHHEATAGEEPSSGIATTEGRPRTAGGAVRAVVRPTISVGVCVLSAVLMATAAIQAYRTTVGSDRTMFDHALVVPAAAVAIALLAAGLALWTRRGRRIGILLMAAVVLAQGAWFAHTMWPLSARSSFYPTTSAHRFLQENIGDDRWAGLQSWGYSPTSDYYHLRTPVGHEFTTDTWADLLTAVDPGVRRTGTYSQFSDAMNTATVGHSPILDQLSVKYWATDPNRVVGTVTPDLTRSSSKETITLAPGEKASCTIPGGPTRGVAFRMRKAMKLPATGRPLIHVEVDTPNGTLTSTRVLTPRLQLKQGQKMIAVPGEDLPAGGRYSVRLWITGMGASATLLAEHGSLACGSVEPTPGDDLTLVFTSATSLIYRRETSLPRIRWAGTSQVVSDPASQVTALAAGIDRGTVLLDNDTTPAALGSTGTVSVLADDPEDIRVKVDADGRGYLVVADALARKGWSATVDGKEARLVSANHAFAGVPVPAGTHAVHLHYTAPGLATGVKITAVGGIVALLLLVGDAATARRRRRTSRLPA